jgi:hypothetical protein
MECISEEVISFPLCLILVLSLGYGCIGSFKEKGILL